MYKIYNIKNPLRCDFTIPLCAPNGGARFVLSRVVAMNGPYPPHPWMHLMCVHISMVIPVPRYNIIGTIIVFHYVVYDVTPSPF